MSAGSTARARKPAEGNSHCIPGRPVGTCPMTGASFSHSTPSSVPGDQRHQGTRQESRQPARPERANSESNGRDGEGANVDIAHRLRERADRVHGSAGRGGRSEERQNLNQYDDDADAGLESRDDDIRCIDHEAADPRYAHKHLQQAGQNDHRQGFGDSGRVAGDDHHHGDGHWHRGARYLGPRATEHRREKTDRDQTVQAGSRTHARRDAQGQHERKRHHHGGEAAKEIPAKRMEIVVHVQRHQEEYR